MALYNMSVPHVLCLWLFRLAALHAAAAAGVELAALRRIDRTGDIALEHRQVTLFLRLGMDSSRASVYGMHRVVEDLL